MRLLAVLLVMGLVALAGAAAYPNGSGEATDKPTEETTATEIEATSNTSTSTSAESTATGPTKPTTDAAVTMTPPTGVPTPAAGAPAMTPEVEMFNSNLVVAAFGVDKQSVMSLRQAGWAWGDINLIAQIASRSGQPLTTIASWRSQGLSWADIASRYNLTAMDITMPSLVTTRVAGFVAEYGYQPIYYRTDPWGNPVLTRYEARRLSRLGYNWQSIAVAANIAAEAGVSVQEVLAWTDRGYTWTQIARQYAVDPRKVTDISKYPFAKEAGMMPMVRTGGGPTRMEGGMMTY